MPSTTHLTLVPYNTPLLRVQAGTIDFPLSPTDATLIEEMLFSVLPTQLAAANAPWPSAAGMAAPQWNRSRRIVVIARQHLPNTAPAAGCTGATGEGEVVVAGSEEYAVCINPSYSALPPDEAATMAEAARRGVGGGSGSGAGSGGEREGAPSAAVEAVDEPLDAVATAAAELAATTGEIVAWEGCFSVPGMRGAVRRHCAIAATFQSIDGVEHTVKLHGW
jgi:peptide deformylase